MGMTFSLDLGNWIRDDADFKEGVIFKDIAPLLDEPGPRREAFNQLIESCSVLEFDKVVAIDGRGFLFAMQIAEALGKPLVMARKPGKLPGPTVFAEFVKEYDGVDRLEMQKTALAPGQSVLIVDDVLARGGTAMSVVWMVEAEFDAKVAGLAFIIRLVNVLKEDDLLDYPLISLIDYE